MKDFQSLNANNDGVQKEIEDDKELAGVQRMDENQVIWQELKGQRSKTI